MDELYIRNLSPRAKELHEELGKAAYEEGENLPCSNAPDLFFPEIDSTVGLKMVKNAKRLCDSCPLIVLCAEYAIEANETHGIWGGLTTFERQKLKRRFLRGAPSVA